MKLNRKAAKFAARNARQLRKLHAHVVSFEDLDGKKRYGVVQNKRQPVPYVPAPPKGYIYVNGGDLKLPVLRKM